MTNGNKNPEVRFSGFSDNWVSNEISHLLEEKNVQAPKSIEYPLMAFIAYEGVAPKGERYNREFLVNDQYNKKYKQTEYGDFIYSSNNLETGSIGLNNYGKASISPVYSIFQPKEDKDSNFLGRLLTRKKIIQEMVRWRQGVIYGQWRIHESDFLKIKAFHPSYLEQKKIGNLFKELDKKITLHKQKHEKLDALKKAMLTKMFPESSSNIPEIRFRGFTRDWQEVPFSEVFDLSLPTNSLSRIELSETNGDVLNIHYGDVLVEYGSVIDVEKTKIPHIINSCIADYKNQLLKNGDVVIADAAEDNTVAKATEIYNIKNVKLVAGLHTIVCRPKPEFAPFFLGHYLNSYSYRHSLFPLFQGTKVLSISKTNLTKTFIKYPKERNEQLKIGNYFKELDTLISQHKKEFLKLQSIKNACLDKMYM